MKTTRHTINLPAEMGPLLNDRIADFRSLSAYFVALCFTDLLYLPKRPIAKAFANASWRQQRRAIESIVALRKQGWKGLNSFRTTTGRITRLKPRNSSPRVWPRQTNWSPASRQRYHRVFIPRCSRD